jgi:hypothetical protein
MSEWNPVTSKCFIWEILYCCYKIKEHFKMCPYQSKEKLMTHICFFFPHKFHYFFYKYLGSKLLNFNILSNSWSLSLAICKYMLHFWGHKAFEIWSVTEGYKEYVNTESLGFRWPELLCFHYLSPKWEWNWQAIYRAENKKDFSVKYNIHREQKTWIIINQHTPESKGCCSNIRVFTYVAMSDAMRRTEKWQELPGYFVKL